MVLISHPSVEDTTNTLDCNDQDREHLEIKPENHLVLISHPSPQDTTISLGYNNQDRERLTDHDQKNKMKLRTIWP